MKMTFLPAIVYGALLCLTFGSAVFQCPGQLLRLGPRPVGCVGTRTCDFSCCFNNSEAQKNCIACGCQGYSDPACAAFQTASNLQDFCTQAVANTQRQLDDPGAAFYGLECACGDVQNLIAAGCNVTLKLSTPQTPIPTTTCPPVSTPCPTCPVPRECPPTPTPIPTPTPCPTCPAPRECPTPTPSPTCPTCSACPVTPTPIPGQVPPKVCTNLFSDGIPCCAYCFSLVNGQKVYSTGVIFDNPYLVANCGSTCCQQCESSFHPN